METQEALVTLEHLDDLEARKGELAYQFWEDEGRPEGKSEEHWNKACLVLMSMEEEPMVEPEWLRRSAPLESIAETIAEEPIETKAAKSTIETIRRRLVARNAA
jgi:hypothetical protein